MHFRFKQVHSGIYARYKCANTVNILLQNSRPPTRMISENLEVKNKGKRNQEGAHTRFEPVPSKSLQKLSRFPRSPA